MVTQSLLRKQRQREGRGLTKLMQLFAILGIIFICAVNINTHIKLFNNDDSHSSVFNLEYEQHLQLKSFLANFKNSTKPKGQKLKLPLTQTIIKSEMTPSQQLHCDKHGGPEAEISSEMVYWKDIPSDANFMIPFQKFHLSEGKEKFVLFEPDIGGWNNIRMALETIVTLSISMGRTLVLPPEQPIYLLGQQAKNQKWQYTFHDFFDLNAIQSEHVGLKIISMTHFLERFAMSGKLKSQKTGKVSYPPGNRTNWDKLHPKKLNQLYEYLRLTVHDEQWNPNKCFVFFPSGADDSLPMEKRIGEIFRNKVKTSWQTFNDNPVDTTAPADDRIGEYIANRQELCFYNEEMQTADAIHFKVNNDAGVRLLVPFYAFLFFEDWKQDTWTKRFVRDHFRYKDEIMCAAARVVNEIRSRAKARNPVGNSKGSYDSMHIRRGDFQYKDTRLGGNELHDKSKMMLKPNSTIFIATDERNKTFFAPFEENYDILFLKDFKHLIKDINSNYYGMLDQLIASRGNIFFGTFYSTFTAYINRMRGYYSIRDKLKGYEKGELQSFYFHPKHKVYDMTKYSSMHKPFWSREFPIGWRGIDQGINLISKEK